MRAGDVLGAAAGRRLFSQADLRGALHRLPHGEATLDVLAVRRGKLVRATLTMQGTWRKTVVSWRMSISQGVMGVGPGFWPNRANAADRKRAAAPVGTMCVRPWVGRKRQGAVVKAGLRNNDLLVAVDGVSPDLVGRAFVTWFRLRHEPGDEVELTLINPKGVRRTIRYEARGWGK